MRINLAYKLLAAIVLIGVATQCREAQSVESLSVMSFNVWSGEDSDAGRDKLVEIIQAANPDIVGLQEMGASRGLEVATALGYHFHQQSGSGIQILSRYPVVGQSPSNRGAQINLAPGQNIWLFNAHLPAYPYQPYDLRDGILAADEQAVIDAANAARGAQLTGYLDELDTLIAEGGPVFLTGDFNEPSHLDWTQAAADATDRPFDLKVEYPTSKRTVDAGMTDSFRAVRPDGVNDRAYTWTPGYPPPTLSSNEVHDRIDLVYHSGDGVIATDAKTLGLDSTNPNTDIAVDGYNSDHRAVVVTFDLPFTCSVFGDLDGNCTLDAGDWNQFRSFAHTSMAGLTENEAYRRSDLNGDFANNHADFVIFKMIFENANGQGSFAAMLASVPEPGGLVPCLLAAPLGLASLRWRRS